MNIETLIEIAPLWARCDLMKALMILAENQEEWRRKNDMQSLSQDRRNYLLSLRKKYDYISSTSPNYAIPYWKFLKEAAATGAERDQYSMELKELESYIMLAPNGGDDA